ncbi:MAG: hypothetical protein KME26_29845 [Oscillatoria princeps RMCB-10]|jgi:mRNA-degrading endonuclease RelE of RelBE toxin-antitoxin system|nr:hypothetical protein [Oscillatoria princeps RMCB-10]
MDTSQVEVELSESIGLYRIRIDSWRVIYVVEEDIQLVTVLAVRKRPPYQYDDLVELISQVIEMEDE